MMVAVKKKKPQRAKDYVLRRNGVGCANYINRNYDRSLDHVRVVGTVAETINTIHADMSDRVVSFTVLFDSFDDSMRIRFVASREGYAVSNGKHTIKALESCENKEALTKAVEDRIMLYLLGGQF